MLQLELVVTGTHLLPEFGLTLSEIEQDRTPISQQIEMPLESDNPTAAILALSAAMRAFGRFLPTLAPDGLVLLGDRYELLAFAATALLSRVPILHINGGELTEGAIDDSVRHAITKMAWLHFPSTEIYGRRIVQMGEDPRRVHVVGALGIDAIGEASILDRSTLSRRLNFDVSGDYILVTCHPTTLGEPDSAGLDALTDALESWPDLKVIITGVNADVGHRAIDGRIRQFAEATPGRVMYATSLGQSLYFSAMKHCAAVVGNSSSGLIEAPTFGVPTVNIGIRQKGRVRAQSVIDCDEEPNSIAAGLRRALSASFRETARNARNPHGAGGAACRITEVLEQALLGTVPPKAFFDWQFDPNLRVTS